MCVCVCAFVRDLEKLLTVIRILEQNIAACTSMLKKYMCHLGVYDAYR